MISCFHVARNTLVYMHPNSYCAYFRIFRDQRVHIKMDISNFQKRPSPKTFYKNFIPKNQNASKILRSLKMWKIQDSRHKKFKIGTFYFSSICAAYTWNRNTYMYTQCVILKKCKNTLYLQGATLFCTYISKSVVQC